MNEGIPEMALSELDIRLQKCFRFEMSRLHDCIVSLVTIDKQTHSAALLFYIITGSQSLSARRYC